MGFSVMQKQFFAAMKEGHRWNIKTGATRSGKTYMDYFVIPMRIRACTGSGLIVLMGNTTHTLVRNVIDPMRSIWGDALVGRYSSQRGIIRLFGKECYLLGADNKTAVKRMQGTGIEYCYGDELTTWNEDAFNMLKSRLDKPNSVFDGTCNPDNPGHFIHKFLESDADIFCQAYTLDDNPYETEAFKTELKKEYAGTVYYERFILGKWVAAQGVIWQLFAANPHGYDIPDSQIDRGRLGIINIGVDFGGNRSGTTFVASGITAGYGSVIVLKSRRYTITLDPFHLNASFLEFAREIMEEYGRIDTVYCDSAESILIKGIKDAVERAGLPFSVRNALKTSINGRIRLTSQLISTRRLFLREDGTDTLRTALSEALWNDKKQEDERLDDGSTDVDSLDAFEYSIEKERKKLIGEE
ncbi:MAG: terminase family protein [Lachnospiraceae bacterium]|jgi:PBSX family phage terminase large subunit|nr:terminase family protein [Lachnospiraceae bacterium]